MNNVRLPKAMTQPINRRAFLRGAGGAIAIGLPFLEGLPERSAWAAGSPPVFGFFLVAACGVVGKSFFPVAGELNQTSLAGKAVEALAPYAPNLLMLKGVKYPGGTTAACGHAQGLCQALTGVPPTGSGTSSQGDGISADQQIAKSLGASGWNLYSGARYYIAERISFSGAGKVLSAELNPYTKFQTLMGVMPSSTASATPATSVTSATPAASGSMTVVDYRLANRASTVDLIADELKSLLARSELSRADKQRLNEHVAALRQQEVDMLAMGKTLAQNPATTPATPASVQGCTSMGIDSAALNAMKSLRFSQQGNMIEDVVKMHMSVVALAFSCNAIRVAALQWGDGTDGTKYSDIGGPGWPFHQISHRVQSDASVGTNAEAEAAHAKVDVIRMKTLAAGLKQFQDRGLLQNSFVYWTNHVADGPSHSLSNLPVIIAGSAGGKLKQGQHIDANCDNSRVLAPLIQATGASAENWGAGKGQGLDAMLA